MDGPYNSTLADHMAECISSFSAIHKDADLLFANGNIRYNNASQLFLALLAD